MTGHTIQIASFDTDRKLIYHKTELDSILNKPHLDGLFIAVYSFVGADRTEKSFNLSILERCLRSNIDHNSSDWLAQLNDNDEPLSDASKWRGDSEGETKGIWAWSEVFVVDGPDGQKVGLLLMNTQGLFNKTNADQPDDGRIFTLSTLISSIQIFNMKNIMQEDQLVNFHFFHGFGDRGFDDHSSIGSFKAFQRIIFLISDWQCLTEFSFGSEEGSRFIGEFFNIFRYMESNLSQIRQYIRSSFDQVDCYLMPFPGTEVTNGSLRLSEMDDEFKKHLEKFINFLFPDGMVQPKTMAGTRVLASDLSSYIEYFVNRLNSYETLSDKSMFQAKITIHNCSVARNAIKEYKTCVATIEESNNAAGTFMSVDNLELQHEGFYRQALDFYSQHQMADANSLIFDQLKKDLDKEFENWEKRNELVDAQIINLNESAMTKAKKMYTSTMEEWFNLNKTTPSIEMTELMDHHQRIKQNCTESLKNQLKGGPAFASSFIQRLSQFVEGYFHKFIVAENESNRKHEKFCAEMTNLLNQIQKQRVDNEKAIRSAAEAEIAWVKVELEQKQREDELKAKDEHNETMMTQIKRIEDDMKKAIREEWDKYQKEVEKLRAEEADRRNKLKKDQEDRDKDEDEGSWSNFLLQAVPAVLNFIPDFNERN